MSARLAIDPQYARYQSTGAVVSLQQLLIQRYAARTLEYLAHNRSSPASPACIFVQGIDFEEFPYRC